MSSSHGPAATEQTIMQRTPIWVIWLFAGLLLVAFFYSQVAVGSVAERNQEARVMILQAEREGCERRNEDRRKHNEQNVVMREVFTWIASDLDSGEREELLGYVGRLVDVEIVDCEKAYPDGIARQGV